MKSPLIPFGYRYRWSVEQVQPVFRSSPMARSEEYSTASSSRFFQIPYRYTSQSKSFASCTAGSARVRVW